jgi:hypothetical protein
VVFVNTLDERDTAPGGLRAAWLGRAASRRHRDRAASFRLGTDFDDEDAVGVVDGAVHRDRGPTTTGRTRVFSSDDYVVELASRFEADHVVVDADRVDRADLGHADPRTPADHLHRLAPPVRTWVEANWL